MSFNDFNDFNGFNDIYNKWELEELNYNKYILNVRNKQKLDIIFFTTAYYYNVIILYTMDNKIINYKLESINNQIIKVWVKEKLSKEYQY